MKERLGLRPALLPCTVVLKVAGETRCRQHPPAWELHPEGLTSQPPTSRELNAL